MLSFLALIVIATVSLVVYALTPFRAELRPAPRAATAPHGVTSRDPPPRAEGAAGQPGRGAQPRRPSRAGQRRRAAGLGSGLAPELEQVLLQPLQPLPRLLELVAERVGVQLEQGSS